ncbi:MAG: class I SAM-dependent methyltransferase [Proteobacteria bacterium]|nr:class I SAM-dependent methyltransferase [Pseudomonadota bacterium]
METRNSAATITQLGRVKEYYNRVAPYYNRLMGYKRIEDHDVFSTRPWLRDVLKSTDPGGLVLDFGCGTGWDVISLSTHGYETIGMDISERMLNVGRCALEGVRRELHASLVLLDNPDLPLESESIGCVLCLGSVLSHFPSDYELNNFFRMMNRVTRPGGTIVLEFEDYANVFRGASTGFAVHFEEPISNDIEPLVAVDLWTWQASSIHSRLILTHLAEGRTHSLYDLDLYAVSIPSVEKCLSDCGFAILSSEVQDQHEQQSSAFIFVQNTRNIKRRRLAIIKARKVYHSE